jgi:WD40 repeat protein
MKPFIKYNRIDSTTEFSYNAKELRRISFLKSQNSLLVTDSRDGSLKLIDFRDGRLIDTLRHVKISSPGCLDVNKKEHIFICDVSNWAVLVFELKEGSLSLIREFKLSNVSFVSDIRINEEGNESLLYVSSIMDNRISIWNSENGEFVKSIKVNHPSYMEFSGDRFYVVSYTICEEITETNKFLRISEGLNCIFEFDKATFDLIRKIEICNWLRPNGLYLDSQLNIVTTAFEIDDGGFISKNRFVYVIDQNGCLVHKIEIFGILRSYYIQFIEQKLVASFDKSIKFIQFD